MATLELLLVALVGIVAITPLANRSGLPLPVLLSLFGVVLGLVPGLQPPHLPPDLVLPLVLPPLLFAATVGVSVPEFRRNRYPLLVLAFGLVLVTTVVVAGAAHAVQPALPLSVAVLLGAVVSPPDPVAATSVAGPLGLPRRLVTLLEGEGMFNDAVALVLFEEAVRWSVSGHITVGETAWLLTAAVVGGVVVGLLVGWLAGYLLSIVHDAGAEITLTLIAPYAAYIAADSFGGSGVLAVLTAGLMLGRRQQHLTSLGWLQGRTVWSYADYVISGVAFVLLGLVAVDLVEDPDIRAGGWQIAIVACVAVVLVRPLVVFPLAAVLRRIRRNEPHAEVPGWGTVTVVSWAGMRGVVTLAAALSIPRLTDAGDPFPFRSTLLFTAVAVIAVTLLAQGLTLPSVVKAAHLDSDREIEQEVRRVWSRAAAVALDRLQRMEANDDVEPAVAAEARSRLLAHLPDEGEDSGPAADPEQVRVVEDLLTQAERDEVLRLRNRGDVSPAAADEVLTEIQLRRSRG